MVPTWYEQRKFIQNSEVDFELEQFVDDVKIERLETLSSRLLFDDELSHSSFSLLSRFLPLELLFMLTADCLIVASRITTRSFHNIEKSILFRNSINRSEMKCEREMTISHCSHYYCSLRSVFELSHVELHVLRINHVSNNFHLTIRRRSAFINPSFFLSLFDVWLFCFFSFPSKEENSEYCVIQWVSNWSRITRQKCDESKYCTWNWKDYLYFNFLQTPSSCDWWVFDLFVAADFMMLSP